MEFSKEKNQTKSKIFSQRYFLVLFFLLFLVITFFPTHNANAQISWESNADYNKRVYDTNTSATKNGPQDDSCSIFSQGVKCFVLPFFKFNRIIFDIAMSLFSIMINADNIQKVLGNDAIYSAWAFVRDLLNMAFIMVLLFSAFCTIFQIEQYNYKKVLWKIVLMALLVNFSFPITRIIIDSSNILMYSLLKTNIFADPVNINGGLAEISQFGKLGDLMQFSNEKYPDTASLLAATVMFFMLAMTFLAIGVLLMIRLIALAIIIIFSPVAFTGSIIPGISAQASKWWDNLIKYSFFGPIMILGIVISVGLMRNMGPALSSTDSQGNFIGTLLAVSVPIVLLWIVMGVAQSMSITGAGAVMGAAQGAMKWSGKLPWRGIKKAANATGIPGGVKQAWNKNITQPFDRSRQNREAKWAGRLGDKSAAERNMKTRAAEYEKNKESESDLKKWASGGDAAAAYTLASIGKIDQKTFGDALNHIKDARTKESLMSKAEDTRMDVTLQYKFDINAAKATTDPTKKAWANIQDAAKTEYGNLNVEAWSKQKNLTEQFAPSPLNPHAAEIEAGAKDAFHTILDPLAQIEALKRMRGLDATAIK